MLHSALPAAPTPSFPPATAAQRAGDSAAPPPASDAGRTQRDPSADAARNAQLAELRARDREVRAHEQAHLAAAGGLATSGPNYSLTIGPDGRLYAVGGSVDVDTSPVAGDPEATIDKARQLIAAALAPAQPSSADLKVAAQAAAMELRARLEIALRERESGYGANGAPTRDSVGLLLSVRA